MHRVAVALAGSTVMSTPSATGFCVIVPVKPSARAKSRLAPLGEEARRALATALALDTVTAAAGSSAVGAVLVVTDDHVLAARMTEAGAHVVPDGASDDLNESLRQAAFEARRRWPDLSPAALCADLPALDSDELTAALQVAEHHDAAFVADAEGVGTTMLAAVSADDFLPRFGPASSTAHADDGAYEIVEVAVPTLRRDVDTPEDLEAALRLGAGERTRFVLTGLRL